MHSDIVILLLYSRARFGVTKTAKSEENETRRQVKLVWKGFFGDLEDKTSFTFKFEMLEHNLEEVSQSGNLSVLDAVSMSPAITS